MECIINLESLGTETRKKPVFYASHDLVVYKEGRHIELANCAGEVLAQVPCPPNARQYEYLDLDDALVFIFGGKDLILFDKSGEAPLSYRIETDRWGKVITKLYPSHHKNAVVFGTKVQDRVQFINFNFVNQERISQSTSWKVNGIDDVVVKNGTLYSILDSSFLVSCRIETCETLWTRFEYSLIKPKIIPYNRGLLYTCQNVLKFSRGETSDLTKIPMIQISNLIGVQDDHLFLTSNQSKNICAYNLKDKKLIWEIVGQSPILETLLVKGQKLYDIDLVLLARMKDDLSILNLTEGRSSHYFKLPGAYRMRQTADHVLVHKYNQHTDMIPGIRK
ncbi:hypothetical protein LCGC14_1302960 [marine sediment metagenome]|uniref:Uncharacterized protein n=1 Tax=marine sediment metagenome TaxID=412755 RepID=A0A0F9L9N3_9ZZZZ